METQLNDIFNKNNLNTPQSSNNIRISLKPSENSNINNNLNNYNNLFNNNQNNNNKNFLDNPLNLNKNNFNEINFNFDNININENPNNNNNNNNGINLNANRDSNSNKQNNFINLNNKINNNNNNVKSNNNNNLNYSVNSSIVMNDSANNYTREEVIQKCSNIFFNFSKLDKKDKQFYINITNIKKIFKTVNLIDDKSLRSSDIDILIKKINSNKTKFSEKNFLDLIVMIAARIYPKDYTKNPKNTVDNLILTFFEPFSKHIEEEIDLAEALKMPYMHRSLDLLISKFVIDYKLIALLNNVLFAVKEIYKNYFNMESIASKNYAKIAENSQANLIQFCKDFEIMPFMLNQDQLVIYFDLIAKVDIKNLTNSHLNPNPQESYENFVVEPKKDLGTVFTLSRFCTSLIHFSIFSFSKNNQLNLGNINDAEKFLLFLEKLENSKGFQNFEKKSNRPHTTKLTLIPSKSVLKMINSSLLQAYDFFGEEENSNLNLNNKSENLSNNTYIANQSQRLIENEKLVKDYNEKARNNEELDLRALLNITEDIFESLINSRIDSLKDLFLRYAKLGEKLNTARISLSSFMKFLRDSGVLQADKNHKISVNNQINLSNNINKFSASPSAILSKTPTKALSKPSAASFSKSPISSRTAFKAKENNRESSSNNNLIFSDVNNNSNNVNVIGALSNINSIAANKKIKNSSFYGPGERKLSDSEVNIIYSVLMGPRHLDNTGKIKHYFDKNAGFSLGVNDGSKYAHLDKSHHGASAFNGKMDFNMFVKSFELIANKLFPELRLNNAMQKLFNEYICKVLNTKESVVASKFMQEIVEKVRNPEMKEFLLELYNYLIFHYQNYSDNNGYMSFEQMFEFYKDFSIFPDIITLIQIKTIFNSLSEYFNNVENKEATNKTKCIFSFLKFSFLVSQSMIDVTQNKSYFTDIETKIKKKNLKKNFINYPLFLESLAITAMSFKFNERFTDIDKILYLIERMNQSKGINCSQFRCGNTYNASKDLFNFLAIMKEKYPDFYNLKMSKEESKGMPIRFDDIYNAKDF